MSAKFSVPQSYYNNLVSYINQFAKFFFLLTIKCYKLWLLSCRFQEEQGLQPDSFTSALFRDLDSVEDTKPGTVARVLQPLLQSCPCPSLRLSVESYGGLERVKQASAVIHEPAADSENVHKFTAGLVLGITMDAEIENVENIKNVRVKVSKICSFLEK